MKRNKSIRLSEESIENVERIAEQKNESFSSVVDQILSIAKLDSKTDLTEERVREIFKEELALQKPNLPW